VMGPLRNCTGAAVMDAGRKRKAAVLVLVEPGVLVVLPRAGACRMGFGGKVRWDGDAVLSTASSGAAPDARTGKT
jgi:hypothetical protein